METLHQAAEAIRLKKTTPLMLLDECLANIDRYEPKVHAWVFVDRAGARAEAERLTRELEKGQDRGPLHGIPIAIKDIFDVFDWPTAAGSKLWANSVAREDAEVVKRLREAGAVFLGKTVTTQYASFDPPVTRNPWKLDRTPGGSSSGSAAALACGMCYGALGSQTGGSITRPASYCGVAGCKPTFGRVTCNGVVPLAASMDHPGPMARSVRDLAILLQVMAGWNPEAMAPVPDYAAGLERPRLPPRLGRVRGLFHDQAEPIVREMMDEVSVALAEQGASIKELALPPGFAQVNAHHRTVMAVEAAAFHDTRLRRHPEDYLPNIRALLEEGLKTPAPHYAQIKVHQEELREDMPDLFRNSQVHALLTPATVGPAPDASTTGSPAFNSPWSYTGLPTVSIPVAWTDDGLPLAIQLVGRPFGEAALLSVAAWCEEAVEFDLRQPAG